MKLALAQMKMAKDIEHNLFKTLGLIREAGARGADLILFPEIQLTPFFPQYPGMDVSNYVLREEDAAVHAVCEACRSSRIFAAPNFYLRYEGKQYDTSLLIDRDGQIVGRQKMVHVAQCPCFYEQDYYTPSDEGFQVFDTELGKLGIVVCFDRHYPESVRTEALRGADLILVPTANTSAEPSELFQWEIKIQAFQNSVFIAMCNRVGQEGDMHFSGESILCGPDGATLALAGGEEELLLCEVDLPSASRLRTAKPYTQLRRPECYE